MVDIDKYILKDGANIAVIGGGPTGSFFSIFALKMAKLIDKKIDVVIFEPKNFTKDGPAGCNKCGGVISELLVQTLALEGINLPPDVVQRGIDSYVLHTQRGDVYIKSPALEKRIATVYRGGGPLSKNDKVGNSFDDFLLQYAVKEGATHVPSKISKIKYGEKPVLISEDKNEMEADLVVGAFGINSSTWKLFEGLGFNYKKPEATSAFIKELELGEDKVSKTFGSSIHFFLLPEPKNIKFAALIPKGKYVTLCLLGRNITQQTVKELFEHQTVKELLPDKIVNEKSCQCFPKLNIKSAKIPFTDRVVIIGDAGSTRLFKDGLGASYTMGKAAAKTAVLQGVSKGHFAEYYMPVYNKTRTDNIYGKIIYQITNSYKNTDILTAGMVNVVKKEQQKRTENFPRLSSILWDTFTGNEPYKNIFMRGTNIGMHIKLGLEVVKALAKG